ncbi:hypothetical protein ElyMa_006955600 [Elysia marginata]|uniref:dUTPase-like domain-containing protein n=1 Tax=Elysia marginata TaxID=1093978 RepID=A0AAV4JJM4_9GAST|nr:hypothetical protein ElyMa_006955600 [Elysia marginata]
MKSISYTSVVTCLCLDRYNLLNNLPLSHTPSCNLTLPPARILRPPFRFTLSNYATGSLFIPGDLAVGSTGCKTRIVFSSGSEIRTGVDVRAPDYCLLIALN